MDIIGRLKEPSTWAGLMGVLEVVKFFLPPQYVAIIVALQGLCGGAAVVKREQPAPVASTETGGP